MGRGLFYATERALKSTHSILIPGLDPWPGCHSSLKPLSPSCPVRGLPSPPSPTPITPPSRCFPQQHRVGGGPLSRKHNKDEGEGPTPDSILTGPPTAGTQFPLILKWEAVQRTSGTFPDLKLTERPSPHPHKPSHLGTVKPLPRVLISGSIVESPRSLKNIYQSLAAPRPPAK